MPYMSRPRCALSVCVLAGAIVCATAVAAQQLAFPLKADIPNQDQHLTAATALTNSVFDHSMFSSSTHLYGVYGCDDAVVAFTGTTAIYGPGLPIFNIGCNAGYKVVNEGDPPPISLVPDMTYNGWGTPNHLFYDGHPGIDYQAAMNTQVYAAVSGIVHYPTRIVGLGYPAAAYHAMEIVPDHAQGGVPPYVVYYLHLSTYIGQQPMPANDPDPLPGCSGVVLLPLGEGTHVQAGCLVALSGNAAPPIYHFLPHLHFEVQKVVPGFLVSSRFGARSADVCIDGVISSSYDCVPVDPYGWTGEPTHCDPHTGFATSGDPYFCLTGVFSQRLWP